MPTRPDADFGDLESYRTEYRQKMSTKDGFTPDQQIAMTTIHNQEVARGSTGAILVILSKPTLRSLFKRGVITYRGNLTRYGNDVLKKWCKDARRK